MPDGPWWCNVGAAAADGAEASAAGALRGRAGHGHCGGLQVWSSKLCLLGLGAQASLMSPAETGGLGASPKVVSEAASKEGLSAFPAGLSIGGCEG
eukprot:9100314-Pyramimonas_sp.AAC.4